MQKFKSFIVKLLKILLPSSIYVLIKNIYYLTKVDLKDHDLNISNIKFLMLKLQDQSKELERIKQRSIITDGKLNLLLYGRANTKCGEVKGVDFSSPHQVQDIEDYIDFTVSLRGEIGELKKRYQTRIQSIIKKNMIDVNYVLGKELLDLGAGDGYVTSIFHEFFKFNKITGVDTFLSNFKDVSLQKFEYVTANVVDYLGYTNKKPQFITANHIIEHLSLADQYNFIRKCFNLLESGGYLYIEVPNIYNYMTLADHFWADEQHLKLFPLTAIRVLIDKLGFIPFYGVYTNNNDFIALDEYHSLKSYNENIYSDIFLLLRKK